MPGTPRPYHLLYSLRHTRVMDLRAAYGSLLRNRSRKSNKLFVDVRVGSHRFDNYVDGGLEVDAEERESADWIDGPDDLDPQALAVAFWKLTQLKFDEAQEDYLDHRKALISEFLRDEVDAFNRERPVVHMQNIDDREFPQERWGEMIRDISRVFLDHPDVYDPSVGLHVERVHRWLCTSDGARVLTEEVFVDAEVSGWALTEDGVYVEGSRQIYRRRIDQAPTEAELRAAVAEVLAELGELRTADSPGSFIGPALLAGQAASTMFHEALGHRLEGQRLVARGETRTFARRVGDRILPLGLHVYDDPTVEEYGNEQLFGAFRIDDEGIEARRALLVRDGVLEGFLRSRAPVPGGGPKGSTGHGRHDGIQPIMARMGNLFVEGDEARAHPWSQLEAMLVAEAKRQGKQEAAIIRRIRNGETNTSSYEFQVFKGELAEVHIIDVESGKRRRIRDVELVGTPLSVLQRIVAYGGEPEVDQGYCYAESGAVPVSGVAPALLLSEVELQQRLRPSRTTVRGVVAADFGSVAVGVGADRYTGTMHPTPRIRLGDVRLDRQLLRRLARRIRRAARGLGVSPGALEGLGVRIVDDVEMARLHQQYMGEAGTTDVLSFPADDLGLHDLPGAPVLGLGDLVLCWPQVLRQASRPGAEGALDEATVLAVHGLVHLLGHDHRTRAEGRAMRRLEQRALDRLGVPDVPRPYVGGSTERGQDAGPSGRPWS